MWKASETLYTTNSSLVVEVNAGRNERPEFNLVGESRKAIIH
jgi:hypothetical protein